MPTQPITVLMFADTYAGLMALQKNPNEAPDELIRRLINERAAHKDSPAAQPVAPRSGRLRYCLLGQAFAAPNANEAMVAILCTLEALEPGTLEKLSPRVVGHSRNHIARERVNVYPIRRDLIDFVVPINSEWWIGTNISNREKQDFLVKACEILGLTFGSDLKIDLSGR